MGVSDSELGAQSWYTSQPGWWRMAASRIWFEPSNLSIWRTRSSPKCRPSSEPAMLESFPSPTLQETLIAADFGIGRGKCRRWHRKNIELATGWLYLCIWMKSLMFQIGILKCVLLGKSRCNPNSTAIQITKHTHSVNWAYTHCIYIRLRPTTESIQNEGWTVDILVLPSGPSLRLYRV